MTETKNGLTMQVHVVLTGSDNIRWMLAQIQAGHGKTETINNLIDRARAAESETETEQEEK